MWTDRQFGPGCISAVGLSPPSVKTRQNRVWPRAKSTPKLRDFHSETCTISHGHTQPTRTVHKTRTIEAKQLTGPETGKHWLLNDNSQKTHLVTGAAGNAIRSPADAEGLSCRLWNRISFRPPKTSLWDAQHRVACTRQGGMHKTTRH